MVSLQKKYSECESYFCYNCNITVDVTIEFCCKKCGSDFIQIFRNKNESEYIEHYEDNNDLIDYEPNLTEIKKEESEIYHKNIVYFNLT